MATSLEIHRKLTLKFEISNNSKCRGIYRQPQLPLGHGIHMELIGYLAHETLCQLVDFALIVRRDSTASVTNPLNRLLPPSLYTPMTIFKPHVSLKFMSQSYAILPINLMSNAITLCCFVEPLF
jgi:hypothetical protein